MNQEKTKFLSADLLFKKNNLIYVKVAVIAAIIIIIFLAVKEWQKKDKTRAQNLQRIKNTVIDSFLKENKILLDQGEITKAIDNYQKLNQTDTGISAIERQIDFNKVFLIESTTNKKEEYQKLEEELNARKLNSPYEIVENKRHLAMVAAKQGEYKKSVEYLKSAESVVRNGWPEINKVSRDRILSNILDRESYYYLFLNNIENAKKINSEALNLSNINSWAHYTKSLILMEEDPKNNKSEALKEAELAYTIFNDNYVKKADNYNYSQISRKITEAYFLFRLGDMFYVNNNLEEAEKYLIQGFETMGDGALPEHYVLLAKLYTTKKDYEKARTYLVKLEDNGKNTPKGYFIKAKIDLAFGKKESAKKNLETALNMLNTLHPPELMILPGAKNLLIKEIADEINNL